MSLAMLLNAEVVVEDLGKDLAMFCVPENNVVSQVRKPSNTSSPIWSLEFFFFLLLV